MGANEGGFQEASEDAANQIICTFCTAKVLTAIDAAVDHPGRVTDRRTNEGTPPTEVILQCNITQTGSGWTACKTVEKKGSKSMVFRIVCAWCGRRMGSKVCELQGPTEEAVTHTICPACRRKVLSAVYGANKKTGADKPLG
jgi:DNA-directed RNA polymerase subunit RPC12/RpoP